ncbi:MAG: FtsX-like permease family protein [Desulfurivibrionaceae bacterium]
MRMTGDILSGSTFSPALLGAHLQIALRNILRHRRRSLLTVAAVAFSVFCLIVFQALMGGLHQKMMESALSLDTGAIQVHAAGFARNQTRLRPLPNPKAITPAFKAAGITRFAPRLKAPALIIAGHHSSSVYLSGIEPGQEASVTLIRQKIVRGTYQLAPGQILISKGLADALDLRINDSMTLMVQSLFGQTRTGRFTVSGLFATGLDSFDQSHVYLSLATAQTLLEAEDSISEVAASCPPAQAAKLAGHLQQYLPAATYQVMAWQGLVPDLAQLMELNDATFRLLIIILFAIVAMGIANTMTTVIFERFREFGTLTALGATPGGIVSLVMTESLLLGLFAALAGSLTGFGACVYLARYGIDLTNFTSANQYFVAGSVLKAVLTPADFILANAITLATSATAGLYPAWKASRLNPVKALSHV